MQVRAETAGMRKGLEMLEAGIVQAAALAMRAAVEATKAEADKSHPAKHRKIPDPVVAEVEGYRAGRVTIKAVQPYKIRPVKAKVLRFVVAGDVIFARMVRHPGVDPIKYADPAYQTAQLAMRYGAEFYVGEAIRRVR